MRQASKLEQKKEPFNWKVLCGGWSAGVKGVEFMFDLLKYGIICDRIGENHQGKGYATKAVKLAVKNALDVHRFHRLEAGTSPENIGSQIVLIKNGFQFTGRQSKFIYNNGKWNDSISFEKILD